MKFLLFIILFLFFIGAFFGFSVFRFLFGGRPASNQNQNQRQNQSSSKSKKTKKIISRDEGEYIDFEEIKDKDQNNKS